MSRIDLSGLPAPDVLIPIDYENMLAAIKADLISRDPSLTDALSLESDPLTKLLESVAYLNMLRPIRSTKPQKPCYWHTPQVRHLIIWHQRSMSVVC